MKSLVRIILLGSVVTLSMGMKERPASRFGEMQGEVSKAFAIAVAQSPGAFFNLFVYERYIPSIDFDKGLKNAVAMLEKTAIRAAMSPFDPCEPVVEGNAQDKDRDGLPVKATYHLACETGAEKLNGTFEVADQDDNVRPLLAGYEISLKSASGTVKNEKMHKVSFVAEASNHSLKVEATKSQSLGSALLSIGIDEIGAKAIVGVDIVSADYAGNLAERKEGDKASGMGMLKFDGSNLPGFPDAAFVAKLTAEVTFGLCPGASHRDVVVRNGEGLLEDAKGNQVKFFVKDCIGTMTYNGEPIKINNKNSLELPKT